MSLHTPSTKMQGIDKKELSKRYPLHTNNGEYKNKSVIKVKGVVRNG